MEILTILWSNRKVVLLIVLALFCLAGVAYVQHLRSALSARDAKIAELGTIVKEQEVAIQVTKIQADRMKEIEATNRRMTGLINSLPDDVRKALNNEYLKNLNRCIADFWNTGVLPKRCEGYQTGLPVASTTNTR